MLVSPGDKVEDVAADLSRFASVAISFPAFGDGRGYSSARLLVERYKYQGEVRAVGDVLTLKARSMLGENGRRFVQLRHRWSTQLQELDRLIGDGKAATSAEVAA